MNGLPMFVRRLLWSGVGTWVITVSLCAAIVSVLLLHAQARADAPAPKAATGGLYGIASANGVVVYRITRDGITCFVAKTGAGGGIHENASVSVSCVPAVTPSGTWAR